MRPLNPTTKSNDWYEQVLFLVKIVEEIKVYIY